MRCIGISTQPPRKECKSCSIQYDKFLSFHNNLISFYVLFRSEHQFDGKNFDMELHVVYKSDKGNLAVVGVMIKVGKEKHHQIYGRTFRKSVVSSSIIR
ncbi:carbonic anhydrase family protein [Metabacillus sp. DBTR6]|uniref:Carbonic anhydrase family protein n=1 Tax=Metabacillus rhizolycopersici TaxID=2875709 RepID=A0ABS7UQK2_9BACI|nr:carbonic anhydrase family protein [Metabacillus rhizolycopersici]